jgi:hypothetical protein
MGASCSIAYRLLKQRKENQAMTNARINGRLSAIALAVALISFGLACAAATLEDRHVRVEIGEKGELVSLVCKATGHDWAGMRASLGLFIHDRDTPADKGENGLSNATERGKVCNKLPRIWPEFILVP